MELLDASCKTVTDYRSRGTYSEFTIPLWFLCVGFVPVM